MNANQGHRTDEQMLLSFFKYNLTLHVTIAPTS